MKKDMYPDIVKRFRQMGDMTPDQLAELADILEEVSPEIYEHYRALSDMLKGQLGQVRKICLERGAKAAFPEAEKRRQLLYALEKAAAQNVILSEKYEELALALRNYPPKL